MRSPSTGLGATAPFGSSTPPAYAVVQERHPPPLAAGRRLRQRYVTQLNSRPPSFALFASKPAELPDSYRRFLANALRQDFNLPGTPIRMMLRKGKNTYHGY